MSVMSVMSVMSDAGSQVSKKASELYGSVGVASTI